MEKTIIFHCFSLDDFKQIIKEAIKEELLEIRKKLEEKDSEILLTREETCAILKINETSLWKWTKSGKLIRYGIGNRVLYKKSEVLESLKRIDSSKILSD
jgi:hypothetical protein